MATVNGDAVLAKVAGPVPTDLDAFVHDEHVNSPSVPDALDDIDDDVEQIPPYRQPPASVLRPRGYKPGTRVSEKKASLACGERPWWASDDPKVWADNQERMRARGKSETRNIIGWKGTGLSAGHN